MSDDDNPQLPFEPNEPDERDDRTRHPDYETSEKGADSVKYRAGSQKARLVGTYLIAGAQGLTDDEAAIFTENIDIRSCWWKRCSELRTDGVTEFNGEKRRGPLFNEERMVSVLTDKGRKVAAALGY